jgi:hypothetical protein
MFKIYEDAICSDTASFATLRISLRETLTSKSKLTKFNILNDKASPMCKYIITQNESEYTVNRLYKEKAKIDFELESSITND